MPPDPAPDAIVIGTPAGGVCTRTPDAGVTLIGGADVAPDLDVIAGSVRSYGFTTDGSVPFAVADGVTVRAWTGDVIVRAYGCPVVDVRAVAGIGVAVRDGIGADVVPVRAGTGDADVVAARGGTGDADVVAVRGGNGVAVRAGTGEAEVVAVRAGTGVAVRAGTGEADVVAVRGGTGEAEVVAVRGGTGVAVRGWTGEAEVVAVRGGTGVAVRDNIGSGICGGRVGIGPDVVAVRGGIGEADEVAVRGGAVRGGIGSDVAGGRSVNGSDVASGMGCPVIVAVRASGRSVVA